MRNNDEIAIYESYRDEILNKFKNSINGENEKEEPEEPEEKEEQLEIGNDFETEENDNGETEEKQPKKKVVVKSEELSVNIGPQLREILRRLPPVSEDTEILSNIKKAIEKYNSQQTDDENQISESPLKIYDKLIELNAINEEEMENDQIPDFEKSGEEPDVLQSFEDDDYTEFDDTPEWEKDWKSEAEKDKLRELIRQAGSDWRKDDEDFYSSNY